MQKRILKRTGCLVICLAMILSTLSMSVYAVEDNTPQGAYGSSDVNTIDDNTSPIYDNESTEEGENHNKLENTEGAIVLTSPVLIATAGDAVANLSWSKVEGAISYDILDVNTNTTIEGIVSTGYKIKRLTNNRSYSYKVRAVGNDSITSEWSTAVSVKPAIKVPYKVTNFKASCDNKSVTLSWNVASGATSYRLYRYNSSKKKWQVLKETKSRSFKNTKLKVGKKYYYKIAALRTSGGVTARGKISATLKITAKAYATAPVHSMYYGARIKKTAKKYQNSKGKKYYGKLRVGTKVTVIARGKNRYKVKTSGGNKWWIAKGNIRITSSVYTKHDYTTRAKLDFVNNKKKYSSKTKYLIWISHYTQRVNIFQGSKGKWKLIRTCRCATGTYNSRSPVGVFRITYKERGWFYGTTYVKPVVHWSGRNSFHSRIYYNDGRLSDSRIGKPASHGCVRMYKNDINYIYKKMPVRTTVVSY